MWFKDKLNPEKIKSDNTKSLHSIGIEVIGHLPHLDLPKFRQPIEIGKRTMVLTALFQLHLEAPRDFIHKWISDNGLQDSLVEKEKTFLKTDYKDLPEQDQIDIYWYVEAIWAFAWVGGLHNRLTLNTPVEDSLAQIMPNIAKNEKAESFIENFKPRKEKEIFSTLDRFYRAHWFARNNNLVGVKSDKVDLDIIMERRKVLEYVCYAHEEWDEISLDT